MWTTHTMSPKLERVNPLENAKRWFSRRMVVEAVRLAIKVAVFGWLCWSFWSDDLLPLAWSGGGTPWLMDAAGAMGGFCWRAVAAGAVLAVADAAYQHWEHRQGLRMSLYQVRQEYKSQEGDPHRKAELRSRMRKLVKSRSLAGVKKATVVVTNPTHVAVALRYKKGMGAPKVVAKGGDLLARKIRELARKHRVPVVCNPPVARALYGVDVDAEIPTALYRTVAEILVSVTRLEDFV